MTTKRPWTEGGVQVFESAGAWLVAKAETDGDVIAKFASEADARLFAAADGLYDMLQDYVCQHGCDCGHPSCSECKRTREARAAQLRAANPDAFTNNVQASEPAGETE